MKNFYQLAKLKITVIVLFLTVISCTKDKSENTVDTSQKGIKLTLIESEFGGDNISTAKASTKNGTLESNTPLSVTKEIKSGPFTLTAELTEDIPSSTRLKASTGSKADTKLLSLRGAVKYRVVAFNTDGTYVDQAVGDASDPNQVFFGDKLIVGKKYNFFIFSLGSTVNDPPEVDHLLNMYPTSDPESGFTLNYPLATESEGDYMYAVEKDVTILGNNIPTPLTTPLKHMFTKVNILVDDSDETGVFGQAGYQKGGYVSEVPVNGSMDYTPGTVYAPIINMSTGEVIPGTGVAVPSYYFPLQNLTTTGKTVMVNQQGRTNYQVSLLINPGSIKIGHDVNAYEVYFNFTNSGLGMKPGYSYTLKLRFNSDRYVNADGETRTANQPDALYAVIGGYRWDRYNLGATMMNPASGNLANTATQALHGDYYQWGQQAIVANASTSGDGVIAGWNNNLYLPANSWNSGTETAPVKVTANDPCSAGSRIPTITEFNRLKSRTVATQKGTWGDGSSLDNLPGYDAAMLLTSKKSGDINLLFPGAGRREQIEGGLSLRGKEGVYWASSQSSTNATFGDFFVFRNLVDGMGASTLQKPVGANIRCIQNK
ncbi:MULTISPECIES: hypothetical protein [Sphingobacterium]|uniref:hypothetical protein n=1 Tax=Sphingobacterium TaxID=28453 RepID=UPI002580D6D6|nr:MULTISPECIES: hypothetical protein [Sphingobacterium]